MRIAFGAVAITAAALALAVSGTAAHAQVINGEGTFESNRGFDHAPEEAVSVEKPAKPSERGKAPDASRPR